MTNYTNMELMKLSIQDLLNKVTKDCMENNADPDEMRNSFLFNLILDVLFNSQVTEASDIIEMVHECKEQVESYNKMLQE